MDNEKKFDLSIKQILLFLLFIILISFVTYGGVYKASFLPMGYEITEREFNSMTLEAYNLLGWKSETINLSFPDEDSWRLDAILYEVDSQKSFYWLLFTGGSISIYLLIYFIQKDSLLKAIRKSRILFTILFPILLIYIDVNRIEELIHLSL